MFSRIVQQAVQMASVLLVIASSASALQTTIWVSQVSGSDGSFDPTDPDFPYATISKAVELANDEGTVFIIKVVEGDYTQAHEAGGGATAPGYPITITNSSVRIEGSSANPEDFPRLGGDVDNSSLRALFEVVATTGTGDLVNVRLENLDFPGEDSAAKDAPCAVYVENVDSAKAKVVLANCKLARSAMNASGADGRPNILAVAGDASGRETGDQGLELIVGGCTFEPTQCGGIQVLISSNAESPARARVKLTALGNTFTLAGENSAEFAIDFILRAEDGETAIEAEGESLIVGNTIDSREADTDYGIAKGILLGGQVRNGGLVQMVKDLQVIENNAIHGTEEAALYFLASQDDDEASSVNIQAWSTDRNVISQNRGFGIVLDWGGADDFEYLRIHTRGNMIVDNGDSGVLLVGGPSLNGALSSLNDTIAGNAGYGIEVYEAPLYSLANTVIWDNALGSAYDWDASDWAHYTYNNVRGFLANPDESCTADEDGNLDSEPGFVNPSGGDYHITSTACVRNKGYYQPLGDTILLSMDIDGEARSHGRPDIGADEYHPPEAAAISPEQLAGRLLALVLDWSPGELVSALAKVIGTASVRPRPLPMPTALPS
ncbi:MAG: right-handed parallel beta-helix repeat-containing protein [Planctomycetota bacterium]